MTSLYDASSKTLKALILAGGRGKRLGDLTAATNKCLLPFQGKPLIQNSLRTARNLGIPEIVIVVGHQADKIMSTYGPDYMGCRLTYVFQEEQLGLVHAIECAKRDIGNADFLLMLGDEVFVAPQHESMLRAFRTEPSFAICGVIRVEDKTLIRKTYSIECRQGSTHIVRLTEKPENPPNHFMGTGNIVCRNALLHYIERTPLNPKRGERELVDWIQAAIDDGKVVRYHEIAAGYVNVNTPDDVACLRGKENGKPCRRIGAKSPADKRKTNETS